MGLKLRTFNEIFSDAVQWVTARTDRLTDFNVGSALRTIFEAVAMQLEEYYFALKQAILYAIENGIYEGFGFPIEEAHSAMGYVTVNFSIPLADALFLKKGTVFSTSAAYGYMYFESTEEVCAQAGSIAVMVPVKCKTAGVTGNVPAGAITTMVASSSAIASVKNETAFTSGTDVETKAERKRRFQHYIRTLSKATRDAIVYGTLEVDGVAGAWCDDSYIGFVRLYAHDSNGELSDELKARIMENLENYRAGGIEVQVMSIVRKPVDVDVMVMIENQYDAALYAALIKDLIDRMLNEHVVSEPFYLANMIHAIKDAYEDVVINIVVCEGSDTAAQACELIRAGDVTVHCVPERNWRDF